MRLSCSENQFRERIIIDLFNRGVIAHSLGSGTFDLILEGDKQQLVEIKRILYNLDGGFDPFNKGILFSKNQTKILSRMKFPPLVVAYDCYNNNSYLLSPKLIKTEFPIYPHGCEAILYCKSKYFPKPTPYENLLIELPRYCTSWYNSIDYFLLRLYFCILST